MKSRAYIFDVEGTLVDCIPETLECWQRVLDEFGFRFSRDDLQRLSGLDPNDMLRRLIPNAPDSHKRMLEAHDKAFRRDYLHKTRKLPAVSELLEVIKSRGHPIALATTCHSSELTFYQDLMQADDFIDVIICGDEVKKGKPHPDLFGLAIDRLGTNNAVAVGDTPFDAMAALKLGLIPWGVLTGGFSREELQRAGCAQVFANPAAMLKYVCGASSPSAKEMSSRLTQATGPGS